MLQRCVAFVAFAGLVVTVACAPTDAAITTNVKTKLAADEAVKAYEVDVTTRNRVVTLSGEVDNQTAKEQALRIARETDGVRDVIDQLRVEEAAPTTGIGESIEAERGAGREAAMALRDAGITSAVKAKLLADTTVRGVNIDVDTANGIVTLNGRVSSRAEAEQAVTLARNAEGVKGVVDRLQVGP